jgi:hypothetical protein
MVQNGILYNTAQTTLIKYLAIKTDTSFTIPASVTSIGYGAFYRCTSLASVTIPDNVTSIGGYTFSGCSSLASVTIPDNVTSIGDLAFSGCRSLASVTIPNRVTSIGNGAFYRCSSLESVTIGHSVTIFGSLAFAICDNLASITCLAVTPPEVDFAQVFMSSQNIQVIKVPSESVSAYQSAWRGYANIIEAID